MGRGKNKKEVIVKKKLLGALLVISLLAMPLVGCAKPITLTIWEPKHGAVFNEPEIVVSGYVSDAKATVWVDGSRVTLKKSKTTDTFATTVTLSEGENIIEVIAAQGKTDKWKNIVTRKVTVTYTPSE